MDEVTNPHDALFRRAFTRMEEARSLLQSELPPEVAARVDWSTLRLVPGTFVDETLRERHTDLLFTALVAGHAALFYILLEHQSRQSRWMPLRLLRYQLRIWERWQHDHPKATKLPMIVPVVLHHGSRPWTAPTTLREIFDVPEAVGDDIDPYLLQQRFLVDDLAGVTDEALSERALTVFADLTLRALARMRELPEEQVMPEIWRWLDLARQVARAPFGLQKLGALLQYLIEVPQVREEDLRSFTQALHAPVEDTTVTTLAQKWMAQGREEGLEKGIEKGIEEGIEKGRAEMLLRMLAMKFRDLPPEVEAKVREATTDELDRWSERFLTAATLDDVFEVGQA